MDWQLFTACIAVAAFAGAVAGYIAREIEGFPAGPETYDTHHSRESLEQRARRLQ